MPMGQLLTTLASVQGSVGNSMRENIDFSASLYNGSSLFHFFTWAFNSSGDFKLKEASSREVGDFETTTISHNSSTPDYPETHNVDSLSIMWYLASFGTLVMFFLIISFSEVCCKKSGGSQPEDESEVPPPPYDLFAPPTYDSLYNEKKNKKNIKKKKRKCEVFVINVFGEKKKSRALSSGTVARNNNLSGF